MVSMSSVRSAVSICYNMKLNQIKWLLIYIFDRDRANRTEAKINLLSSVKADVRNDIALSPSKVINRAFAEHYLTRAEILTLVFCSSTSNRTDASKRCPHCTTICVIHGNSVRHGPCPVTEWLSTSFQFEYDQGTLVGPDYAYVESGVKNYAKELLYLDAQRRLTPYISRSEQEFKIVTIDSQSTTKVVAQHGSKPVRLIDGHPSTSASTSGGSRYPLRHK